MCRARPAQRRYPTLWRASLSAKNCLTNRHPCLAPDLVQDYVLYCTHAHMEAGLAGESCLPTLNLGTENTVKLCYDEEQIYLLAFGSQSTLSLPQGSEVLCPASLPSLLCLPISFHTYCWLKIQWLLQVIACKNSSYPLIVTWAANQSTQGQVAFASTGCGAVWGSNVQWFAGLHQVPEQQHICIC